MNTASAVRAGRPLATAHPGESAARSQGDTPLSILVAALGGEGGGVLADWIVDCALARGLPVQATSVPGVAQRTGATSYYIELVRVPASDSSRPIFALSPVPGCVDVVLASELLEAARMVERGFVNPQRTTLITARHRVYTTLEKMQMGDGRFDDARIHEAARNFARRCLSLDMQALTARHGTVISAVMFGALAGAGVLPWDRKTCEEAIRRGGLGVESSLAGFSAGHEAAASADIEAALSRSDDGARPAPEVWAPLIATLPPAMHATAAHGVARLIDWQDAQWARDYIDRLAALAQAAPADGDAQDVLAEAARLLALWMSYEDAIRVADLKTRPARLERIRSEVRAGGDDLLRVVDYLKPGYDEIAAILPRTIGSRLRRWAARSGRSTPMSRGMHLHTTGVAGYLALRTMAAMRPLRRRSLRFHDEQRAIAAWLDALARALPRSIELARQIAALPRLLKGYGDTWARGQASYSRIFETLVAPALAVSPGAAGDDPAAAAQRIGEAIAAALADPEGRDLENTLARAGIEPLPPKPKPIVWMRKPRQRDEVPQTTSDESKGSRQIGENPVARP